MDLGAGELYFVREIDPDTKKFTKFVKIGLVYEKEGRGSLDRLSEHQTGNPRILHLPPENFFLSPAINRVESMMHRVFASHRVSGEWFEFETEREVLSAIKKAKTLAAEVTDQIPTFTKATKLGQSQDNGKVIPANSNAKQILHRIAVARTKQGYLSEISKELTYKFAQAIARGENVEGAAKAVEISRKGKFNLSLLKTKDLKTYNKYLVVSETLSGRLTLTKIELKLEDLEKSFQTTIRNLRLTVGKAKKSDYRILNQVQLELTNEIALAEWDEEFALAELKIACGKNRAIQGICTWKRELVQKEKFDEKKFKLENPAKHKLFLEKPKTTSYVRASKRKI